MENPTHSFREWNHVIHLIQYSQVKTKTEMSWKLQKKKKGIFLCRFFVLRIFLLAFVFLSQHIVY